MKQINLLMAALGLGFALSAAPALAEDIKDYPSRTVRIVCPYPPGGTADIVARAISAQLGKVLGQSVIVENRGGSGGNIGAEYVTRAAPDGYTLLSSGSALYGITPVLYKELKYDPLTDLVPIMVVAYTANILVVPTDSPAHSVKDLVDAARANPGALTFGSSGIGTTVQLSGEMFKHQANIDIRHIPYKGSAPADVGLAAGEVSMMFDNIGSAMTFLRAGRMRALATTGPKRDEAFPDLPTMKEAGYPDFEAGVWIALTAPPGTPRAIIDKLNKAARQGIEAPEFVQNMKEMGYSVVGGTPERMAEMIRKETKAWPPIVKAAGIVPN
jgi:tripartite-type tricarboxylate transporter receptor subunit TctC